MGLLTRFSGGMLIATTLTALTACVTPEPEPPAAESQVLFVCLHGNVKSLMAASYFNQLAERNGLPYRAVSRGTEPDSTTVPPAIVAGLRDDGFDVASFRPTVVNATDVAAARRVILINTVLPAALQIAGGASEGWDDVPPASVDYGAARDSLKSHVERLIEQLATARSGAGTVTAPSP